MRRSYKVVDVFSHKPMRGNPVAVVLDAAGLSTDDMQRIAGWTNLSETTFVLPPVNPAADYTLRIFTPRSELPFAGHPTLGSAFAVVEAGKAAPRNGALVQQCRLGLVNVRVDGAKIVLELPPAKITPLEPGDIEELEALLGRAIMRAPVPAIVNVGPKWIIAQFAAAEDVIAAKPDLARLEKLERKVGATGLTIFGKWAAGDIAFEVRSFAPSDGIAEDPVCGSGNGSVAAFLWAAHPVAGGLSYTAAQGRCVGREGRIDVMIDPTGKITLGGACITSVDGTLMYEGSVRS
jgi:PhzF family phenazine biosynthesis protein